MSDREPPQVFISYAHYDGPTNYRVKVAALSNRLRELGVDCIIDQYEENDPPSSWPNWMVQYLQSSKFVLAVCTETYKRRFEGNEEPGKGQGSTWEGGVINAEIYDKGGGKHKYIPITFGPREEFTNHMPQILASTTSYDVTTDSDLDRLLRRFFDSPALVKPPLGSPPTFTEAISIEIPEPNREHQNARAVLVRNNKIEIDQYFSKKISDARLAFDSLRIDTSEQDVSIETVENRLRIYDQIAEPLSGQLSEVAYYGDLSQVPILSKGLKAVYPSKFVGGRQIWIDLNLYPACLLFYSLGTAATASGNLLALREILQTAKVKSGQLNELKSVSSQLYCGFVFSQLAPSLPQPVFNARFPASEYMLTKVRKVLMGLIDETEIELAFDRFEYFLSLFQSYSDRGRVRVRRGRFVYKIEGDGRGAESNEITSELNEYLGNPKWEGFELGFFDSDVKKAQDHMADHYAKTLDIMPF